MIRDRVAAVRSGGPRTLIAAATDTRRSAGQPEPARAIWKRLDMMALSTIKHRLNALVDIGLVARIDSRNGKPNLYRRMPA